ncbi:MAG: hypothetical protein AB7I50_18500 [Vicinamibacterales bacterium]
MDLTSPTPLLDLFRRGEVPAEVKWLAAKGVVAPRASEQVAILVVLSTDRDPAIAAQALATIDTLPRDGLESFLARAYVPPDVAAFFARRGILPGVASASASDDPLVDFGAENELEALEAELEDWFKQNSQEARVEDDAASPAGMPSIVDRMKLAMKGTRAQRAVLIRDPNKMVASAVLSSPKLTDTEVEAFARMANVSDDVLRTIGSNRAWTKNYGVVAALARNPKTPLGVSLPLVSRLSERDMKALSTDRNVPEGLRIAARKMLEATRSRRQ